MHKIQILHIINLKKNSWCNVVVQLPSRVWLCDTKDCSNPGLPVPHHLPEFAQVHVHFIGDAIRPSHPLMPSSSALNLPSFRNFSNESSVLIDYWTFSFSISPSSEYSGLISLLFKGLSVVFSRTTVWRHQFFGILHSLWSSFHKTIVSNTLTFVSRIMGMIFNTLSRFVIAFLPRSNCFMISWL